MYIPTKYFKVNKKGYTCKILTIGKGKSIVYRHICKK